jgi:hypothetical protein
MDAEGVERSQHEPELSAWLAPFDVDDPLPADAHTLSQLELAQPEVESTLPDEGSDVRGGSQAHVVARRLPGMSSSDDIMNMSAIADKSDRRTRPGSSRFHPSP